MLSLNRATGQRKCKRPNCNYSEDKIEDIITKETKDKEMVVEGIEYCLLQK